MPFLKVTPEKLSSSVVRQIEQLILRGILRPGERLPAERELSDRLGVSRPSLRDAIAELSDRGSAVVSDARWAADLGNSGSAMCARLSVVPFVLLLLRYARDVDAGTAEAPEDLVWGDRVLQALGLIWAAMFALQVLS